VTDRRLRLRQGLVGAAVVGAGIAAYLTYVHYAGIKPVCAIAHGCEQVQTSRWSKVAGIPVALLGLIGYLSILAALFVPGERGRVGTVWLALVGWGFSLYLTYREVFTIKAICIWCVASAVVMTIVVALAIARMLAIDDPGVEAAAGMSMTELR
jgi:uncharacterized membrane protein